MIEALIYIGYIALGIGVLMAMITIHELGHYIAGKLLKFKINEFAIGFGPKLFSKKMKNGEVFSIRAIPLGGFCAFEGEDTVDETPPPKDKDVFEIENGQSTQAAPGVIGFAGKITGTAKPVDDKDLGGLKRLNDQPPYKRIIMFAAGGVFNLLSAVIFCFVFILIVGMAQPKVSEIALDEFNKPYKMELQAGDIITHVDGKSNYLDYIFSGKIADSGEEGDSYVFTVIRDGKVKDVTVTRQSIVRRTVKLDENDNPVKDANGKYVYELVRDEDGNLIYDPLFGISTGIEFKGGFVSAIKYCVPLTAKMSWIVLSTLGKLITFQLDCSTVAGPVGTISGIAEGTRTGGWQYLLLIVPFIAANLGVMNLMPIPALDGSKIVFAVIEWIRKKPVSRKVEGMIHAVGLLVLLGLILLLDISGIIMRCGK